MKKFRKWLLETFLPAWAKDTVYADNQKMQELIERQQREIGELNAYIDGLETGLRSIRRIVIRNEVKR